MVFGAVGATATLVAMHFCWVRRMQRMCEEHNKRVQEEFERAERMRRQRFQGENSYRKADTSFRDQSGNYALSHHYSVLGLDRFRKTPYSDAQIKTAFRTKAKEHHPDQNPDNIEAAAEAKFKEVMNSYEAIKKGRRL